MRKLVILSFLVLIFTCSFFVAGYYIMFDLPFSGTYTKAVCDGNMCADYEFTCFEGIVTNSKRISGFILFDGEWIDSRTDFENEC